MQVKFLYENMVNEDKKYSTIFLDIDFSPGFLPNLT